MSVLRARLFVFSDFAAHPDALEAYRELAEGAPPGRVAFILRDRTLSASLRASLGRELARVARGAGQHFLVSSAIEPSLELDADGIHLSSDGPSPHVVRAELPEGGWLSRAAHDFDRLTTADVAALDAVVVSPVWQERKGRAPLGERAVAEWVARVRTVHARCGVIALGGATADVLERALLLGALGVAVLGAALEPSERKALVRRLVELEARGASG